MLKLRNLFKYSFLFYLAGSILFSVYAGISLISFQTILFLYTIYLLLYIGDGILNYNKFYRIKSAKKSNAKYTFSHINRITLIIVNFITLFYFLIFIKYNASLNSIIDIPYEISIKRYNEDLYMPFFLKLMRLFLNFNGMIASIELAFNRNKQLSYIALFFIVFDGIMSSGKAGPLIGLIICYFTYIGTLIFMHKKFNVSFRKFFLLSVVFIAFLIFIQAGRINNFNSDIFSYIVIRLFGYAFSGFNAFDIWFLNSSLVHIDLKLGSQTFMGLYDFLGLSTRQLGVYTTGIIFGDLPPTNIYTGFRYLIEDFSIFVYPYFFVLLVCYRISVRKILDGDISYISIYTMISTYTLWLGYGSLFAYNTYTITFMMFFIYFKIFIPNYESKTIYN